MAAIGQLAPEDPAQVGRYRLIGRIGQGGMGRVYLARSPGGRLVAVKVVRDALARDVGFRQRFVREVRAVRSVTGLFTAAVVDADPEGDPAWLATEYVPGPSLADALEESGAWPEEAVRRLGAALTEALGAVHRAGIVHRDLKPTNVLLAADGPRVIDFGIAVAAEDTRLTEAGVTIGTPGFIAPEQLRGEQAGPAADVFALGAILAYTAQGFGPFGSDAGHAVNYRVVHEEPDLSGVPEVLAGVIARCLAKEAAERPEVPRLLAELGQGAAHGLDGLPARVVDAIARARATPPPEVDDATPSSYGRPRRRRLVAGLVALAVAIVGTTTALVNGLGPGSGGEKKPRAESHLKQLWSSPLDGGLGVEEVADGTVYLAGGETGVLRALDAKDGSRRWQRKAPGDSTVITSVSGGSVYYGSGDYLYAADADSGRTRWKYEDRGIHWGPKVSGDTLYSHFPGAILVQDATTGKQLPSYELGDGTTQDITVAGETVYAHAGQVLHAVNAATQKARWKHTAESVAVTEPVVAGGKVYFGSRDGSLYAVDVRTGEEAWRQRFEGKLWDPRIADGADAPVVVDGTVYFENDGYVSAFDAGTGKVRWRHRPAAEETASLAAHAGTVYYAAPNGTLHALNGRTGKPGWKEKLASGDDWRPRIVDGTIYFTKGGRLRAAALTAG